MKQPHRGGSRIFSRGGGGGGGWRIFKKNPKILTFFLGQPNRFFELSQSNLLPLFWQKFLRRRQIFEKKTVKKGVFRHFLKNFDKKIAFIFGARSPSKLVYIGAKGAFRKILGSIGQNGFLKKYQRGDPLGRQGVESLRGGRPPPPPPKSAPATTAKTTITGT